MTQSLSPTVLVGWDWEEAAAGALRWAADYARLTRGRVLLVHVVVPLVSAGVELPPIPALSRSEIEGLERAMRQTAAQHDVRAEAIVAVAPSIARALIEAAQRHGASLLCVGHGREGLARLLLGSTASQVVRQSPLPVLVVRG